MRIAFICGSLDPGKDGVGDYTRRLARQFGLSGHQCLLVSLCDTGTRSTDDDENPNVCRYQNALRLTVEADSVEDRLKAWRPDVISLQFVCFAFHSKGLIHRLSSLVEHWCKIASLHVMFHELWLGEQPDLPFKHRLLGKLQKWQITSAVRKWKPFCIHTSNTLYREVLKAEGIPSNLLPIFGNIPVASVEASPAKPHSKKRKLIFPFSQRNDWNVEETLSKLKVLAAKSDLSYELIQVGRLRNDAKHWQYIERFAQDENWECRILGERDEEELSRLMQSADIGICAAHVALANESGAAIAMLEHGLPVICTITQSVSDRFKHLPSDQENLHSFFDSEAELLELIKTPVKQPPRPRLPMIAEQWLKDIETQR